MASRSNWRAIALSPPAVFSIRIGSGKPPSASARSKALRQFSTPTFGSSLAVTWPPCTMSPLAPISAAASACCCMILRLGMRILLLVDGDVDEIRRVDVDGEVAGAQLVGVRMLDGLLPALRVTEEELDRLGTRGRGGVQRILGVDVGT